MSQNTTPTVQEVLGLVEKYAVCPAGDNYNQFYQVERGVLVDAIKVVFSVVESKLPGDRLQRAIRLLTRTWFLDMRALQAFSRDLIYDPYEHDSTVELTPRSPPFRFFVCGTIRNPDECWELFFTQVGGTKVIAKKQKTSYSYIRQLETPGEPIGSGIFYKFVKFDIRETFAHRLAQWLFDSDHSRRAARTVADFVLCLPRNVPVFELIYHLRKYRAI